MLHWILAVLALYLTHILIGPCLQYVGQGNVASNLKIALGGRDNPPPMPKMAARANRALTNLSESLPFFLTFALLSIILEKETDLAIQGAAIFFFARVVYLPAYVSGILGLRSITWIVAVAGMITILTQIVG